MEAGALVLRGLFGFAEHFTGSGEVEAAFGGKVFHRGEKIMGAVDIGVEGGEFVVERVADKTLRGQVIAFVRLDFSDHLVDAGIAFEGGRVQCDAGPDGVNAGEAMHWIFERHSPDDAVHGIALSEQQFRQIRPVLARNAGDEGAFFRHNPYIVAKPGGNPLFPVVRVVRGFLIS
jgi:hypothetical protein